MGNDNMSENNKLIFLDVDATLYSKEQRLVPESTIKAIHEAQENGHKVLINTGRPLVYFEKEIKSFFFKTLPTRSFFSSLFYIPKTSLRASLKILYFYPSSLKL